MARKSASARKLAVVREEPPRKLTPWADSWARMLEGTRTIYRMEVERLAAELRPRILAGEFSEHDSEGNVAYIHLAWELETSHPWCAREGDEGPTARLVAACSTWPETQDRLCRAAKVSSGSDYGPTSGECLAADVLALAAERGWVEPLRNINSPHPYRLKVAK